LLSALEAIKILNKDRRTSARSPAFMMVRARDLSVPMWCDDIGLGGMKCRSTQARWPGSYVDLNFRLPGNPKPFHIGGQITSIQNTDDDEEISLGLRFCMMPSQWELDIYRFLDARRKLWGASQDDTPELKGIKRYLSRVKPFEGLLLEAQAAMRAKGIRRFGFHTPQASQVSSTQMLRI
jgi:hypothetical protein